MMKKILVILCLMLLSGCATKNVDDKLSILVPSGAPSLAFYNEIENDEFNTADAKSILPELSSNGKTDIVVVDAVNGIKALNDDANYKLAGIITFGNFYIASTGLDEDDVMDEDDYIVLFSQNATPDKVFHYIYGDKYDNSIHYVSAVNDASACLIKGINIADDSRSIDEDPYVEYVMIAQPALTAAMSSNENVSIYANIQEEYMNKTNETLIQACVFVSNDLDHNVAKDYLANLKQSIDNLLANPTLFEDKMNELGLSDDEIKDTFGVPNSKIVSKVVSNNSIGLGYNDAYENKEAIDEYIALFGLEKTSEEIYFKE